ARALTSGEYLFDLFMAPSSQIVEPPQNPGRFTDNAPFESINQLHEGEWLNPNGDSKLVQDARELYELWSEERDDNAQKATPKPRVEGLDVGIIGKINGHYDIRELLEAHDYVDMGKWLSPNSESGSPGVHIWLGDDGKERVYSHHGETDPLSRENHEGHSLDTADVLCCLEYGGDYSRMIREEAGELDQHGQKERQIEYVQQKELASLGVVSDEAGNVVSHPLAKVIPLNGVLQTPRWLLPGFMVEGLTLIAGRHGVGKTTALLPLAAGVAGFHKPDWELKPKHWRHVMYVTEDMQQAQRVLQGLIGHLGITASEMNERLHLVDALRMKAEVLVLVGDIYTKKYTRWADGVNLPPLVVLDTQSATIELENENDNSEAGKAIAAFKQQFNGLPVWLIAHVAKTKSEVKNLTSRGASAWEADANATAFIIQEDGKETVNDARWIMLGKRRFEPEWSEVLLEDHTCSAESVDEWGEKQQTMIRWAIANPGGGTRKENHSAELDRAILAAVQEAWEVGEPVNKTACKQKVGGTSEMVGRAIDKLIIDKWLAEIQIPKDKRPHHTKKSYLIALTETERNTFNITSKLPEAKTAIPEGIKGGKLA
ncbi:AAA family ATPase, partial [Nitrosomonas eutropha]